MFYYNLILSMVKKFIFKKNLIVFWVNDFLRLFQFFKGEGLVNTTFHPSNSSLVIFSPHDRFFSIFKVPGTVLIKKPTKKTLYFFFRSKKKGYSKIVYKSIYSFFMYNKNYSFKVFVTGIGYKLEAHNPSYLKFSLGFSHDIYYYIPESIKFFFSLEKELILVGNNAQELGQVSAQLKHLCKSSVYKYRGVFFSNLSKIQNNNKVTLKLGKTKK